MNYFAHALVAARLDEDPSFVLGAMLPDFAHMIGARIRRIDEPAISRGEAHHHLADRCFHASPGFRRLVMDGVRWLDAHGVSRGGARGAAHLGIELLLDGALAGDALGCRAYREALERSQSLNGEIGWSRDDAPSRCRHLVFRLRQAGAPHALRDPLLVTERVARVLEPRRRLRLAPQETDIVERWIGETRPRVARQAPDLLAETLAGVWSAGGSS